MPRRDVKPMMSTLFPTSCIQKSHHESSHASAPLRPPRSRGPFRPAGHGGPCVEDSARGIYFEGGRAPPAKGQRPRHGGRPSRGRAPPVGRRPHNLLGRVLSNWHAPALGNGPHARADRRSTPGAIASTTAARPVPKAASAARDGPRLQDARPRFSTAFQFPRCWALDAALANTASTNCRCACGTSRTAASRSRTRARTSSSCATPTTSSALASPARAAAWPSLR